MIVTEIFPRLMAAFPAFTPAAMESLGPAFRARLSRHEGPVLQQAFTDLLANFKPTPSQRFPMPKDFESYLPTGKIDLGKEREKPLDFKGRAERAPAMLQQWRERQGVKASRGVPEVLQAMQDIALPLCQQAAWKPDAKPVILTHDQLRIARQRAVSQHRHRLHGPPPKDSAVWWAQISEIQAAWSIDIPLEAWTSKTRETPAPVSAAPGERPAFVPSPDPRLRAAAERFRGSPQEAA